ncbi:hypothetical protein HGRIS_007240 [Hohenbuehelia grisea]|uniref:Cytochrome P450 n=1 Tax=Hohenbuehelia grisea TaxID=104357 RepID=A0ABR3JC71_9AGAR
MAVTTPGIDFLARSILRFSPLGIIYIISHQLSVRYFGYSIVSPAYALYLLVFAIVASVLRVVLVKISHRREAKALGAQQIPKVKGRWIGGIDVFRRVMHSWAHEYPGDALADYVQKFGNVINLYVLWRNNIFTTCPEHIKMILATDFNNYEKGSTFRNCLEALLGTGVFNSDGEMWKFHRSMTRPFFSRERISHFDIFDRHADITIQRAKQHLRSGYAIDFQDLMSRFTLDSATEFLFGSSVHSLHGGLRFPHNALFVQDSSLPAAVSKAEEFSDSFLKAQEIIVNRERRSVMWPLFEIFGDAVKDHMKVVNAFVDPIVKEAIERRRIIDATVKADGAQVEKASVSGVSDDENLLDHLVKLTSDPRILKDEALNIMLAGRDTTAATLTFVIYFLAMYPGVLRRLREEVLVKVGQIRRPTYDDIREMKYLRAVINETLRLYPVVYVLSHVHIGRTFLIFVTGRSIRGS